MSERITVISDNEYADEYHVRAEKGSSEKIRYKVPFTVVHSGAVHDPMELAYMAHSIRIELGQCLGGENGKPNTLDAAFAKLSKIEGITYNEHDKILHIDLKKFSNRTVQRSSGISHDTVVALIRDNVADGLFSIDIGITMLRRFDRYARLSDNELRSMLS